MSDRQYATIPQCATQLQGGKGHFKPELVVSIPMPSVPNESSSGLTSTQPSSPTKQNLSISNLLSSTLHLPYPPVATPRDGVRLMSTREPLSLPATTANFRRFVSKSGPVFWLQDRTEEILMWRKGEKVTLTWMAIYTFLCYFPRMFLLLPHVILISILLGNYGCDLQGAFDTLNSVKTVHAMVPQQPKEGSAAWFANLQAIQNLMGAVSDTYDAALPLLPILTWNSPHTSHLLTVTFVSLIMFTPIVIFIPLRPILLVAGLAPFFITHPVSLRILPTLLHPLSRSLRWRVERLIDDNNLAKRHWYSDKQEVELWENERWSPSAGWSKSTLKVDERKAWTIGGSGWCDIVSYGDGDVRNLTFMLSSGYEFIETEDWRLDRKGEWARSGVDDYGWVYTNDFWEQSSSAPLEEWQARGMTRRRRWVRRICFATRT